MDLSNYGKTNTFRRELIAKSPAMIGTVPMYDAIGYLEKDLLEITPEDFLRVVRAHAEEGVDFMTIHAGINRRAVEAFMRDKRRMNIVSRGGSLLFAWMMMTGKENPFYEHYDEVLEILREYDVTISLGDALRPGCIDDSTDAGQVAELIELGSLTERAWAKDVQVMVEGPGHMAMNEIAANMQLQKRLCHNAPFYVLGPIVTDIAPGYDHITAAIGGAIAAANGADFLCYVTPAEHLRLPDLDDVKEGIIASRIAAHAADIAKGVPHARQQDNAMSEARHKVDWEAMFDLALDQDKARRYFESTPPADRHTCSMCGKLCAVRTTNPGNGLAAGLTGPGGTAGVFPGVGKGFFLRRPLGQKQMSGSIAYPDADHQPILSRLHCLSSPPHPTGAAATGVIYIHTLLHTSTPSLYVGSYGTISSPN